MVVVVARVCGVTMTIVDVVDVVAVGDGDVAAALAVDVIVAGVLGMRGHGGLHLSLDGHCSGMSSLSCIGLCA